MWTVPSTVKASSTQELATKPHATLSTQALATKSHRAALPQAPVCTRFNDSNLGNLLKRLWGYWGLKLGGALTFSQIFGDPTPSSEIHCIQHFARMYLISSHHAKFGEAQTLQAAGGGGVKSLMFLLYVKRSKVGVKISSTFALALW